MHSIGKATLTCVVQGQGVLAVGRAVAQQLRKRQQACNSWKVHGYHGTLLSLGHEAGKVSIRECMEGQDGHGAYGLRSDAGSRL